jgi:two-component system, OmpR family, KDP operon response regulator KdpE
VTQPGGRLSIIAPARRGDLKSKLAAFARGVDDILTVPFSPKEFVARVLAIMRRTYRDAAVFTPVLRLGDLEIDILNRHVRAGDTELHLTSLKQSLLYLLAANAGRLLTHDEIWTTSAHCSGRTRHSAPVCRFPAASAAASATT